MKLTATLDKHDRNILYELDKNGRISLAKIAQKIGKGKDFVNYRIKRMKKLGVYVNDVVILDTSKLGYQTYYLYLQIANKQKVPELIKYLRGKPEIWDLMRVVGKYQLFTIAYVKKVSEMEEIIGDLAEHFNDVIVNYRLLLCYNNYSLAHNYMFPNKENIYHDKIRYNQKEEKLSTKEMQFLCALLREPRASFYKLANEIGSTLPKVREMYKDLKQREVIYYIRPILNSLPLGYLHKHISMRLNFAGIRKMNEIKSYLLAMKGAKAFSLTFGRYDITCRFIFNSLAEFQEFLDEFYNKFGEYVHSLHTDDYFEEIEYMPHPAIKLLVDEKEKTIR